MSWYNPFSWLPEDPINRCGWYFFRLTRRWKKDPYLDFCVWDDKGTSRGSFPSKFIPLERWIENGLEEIALIQSQFEEDSPEWQLGERYKHIWPHLVGLFWEGRK